MIIKLTLSIKVLFEKAQEELNHLINQKSQNPLIPENLISMAIKLDREIEALKHLHILSQDNVESLLSNIGALNSITDPQNIDSLIKIARKLSNIAYKNEHS